MEESFAFTYGELRSHCFSRFEDMKRKNEFCDITIRYGNHSITAHRLILAASIPYFSDLLSETGTGNEWRIITVEEIDPRALESLANFAYSCKVTITEGNAKDLLAAACILKIDVVRDACCSFLAKCLTLENALSTGQLAKSYGCLTLSENVDSFICGNFEEMAKTQEFLNSSFECVNQLIRRNDLQCSNEEKVFEFIIQWVKVTPEERRKYLPQLLKKIRMSFLTPEYLTYRVAKEDLIRSSIECRDIVDDAKTYHFMPQHQSEISSFDVFPRCVPRNNVKCIDILHSGIYVVSRTTSLRIQHFDAETRKWRKEKASSFHSDFHHGVLSAGNGGLYYSDRKDIRSYTSANGKWIRLADLRNTKHNCGSVVLNNKLYLCGGEVGESASNSVECYDLEIGDSNSVSSMLFLRCFPGVTALEDHVYVLGGCCNGLVYKSVEKFYPKADLWVTVASMLTERCGMGCTTLGNKIYVCGGLHSFGGVGDANDELLASVEVFDPSSNRWSYVSAMRTTRFSSSLVAFHGKLYVIGGYDENDVPTNTTDSYDPETDEWKPEPSLSDSLGFVQAVAVM